MTDLSELKFFATPPHECSYLDNEEATTLFVDPEAEINKDLYEQLSLVGFRRSGNHLYRPHCTSCSQCIPTRLLVDKFKPSKSQKRIIKRNNDLIYQQASNPLAMEYYDLYDKYLSQRHQDGDMYPPSFEQYQTFLNSQWADTHFFEARDSDGKLVSVLVCDLINSGFSAIYSFFDPELPKRSLGVMNVLWQVQLAKHNDLSYLYLGYWIRNCKKMSYKSNYQPLELYLDNEWVSYPQQVSIKNV